MIDRSVRARSVRAAKSRSYADDPEFFQRRIILRIEASASGYVRAKKFLGKTEVALALKDLVALGRIERFDAGGTPAYRLKEHEEASE